ncbi:redoxin domain-containing protein [Cryomorphaceae bacterium 1068]|nr:redoxin domain-containing protein [Cryomorphaceae bacterium 1068]
MLKKSLIAFAMLIQVSLFGQLPDGSTAPDFTLTDYYGTEHNLYSYLEDGKTVILEIFAAHCPACWNFHQTHRLKNLYNAYGPEGTDELVVLALEHDQWNSHAAFIGDGPPWVTQGNWLDGTPFPIFDVEDPDRGVFEDYNITGYPIVFKICPDGITERIFTSESEELIYEKVQECQAALSVNEALDLGAIYFDPLSRSLKIDKYQDVQAVRVMSITGQVVQSINAVSSPAIAIDQMPAGIYFFEVRTDYGSVVKKFYLD